MINISEIMRKYITAYFIQLKINDMNKKNQINIIQIIHTEQIICQL